MNKIANYDWTHLEQNRDEYIKGGIRKIADAPPIPCHPERPLFFTLSVVEG